MLAAAVRLLTNLWLNGSVATAIGSDLSCEAYKRTLHQPYTVHVARNSNSMITTLQNNVTLLIVVLNALPTMFTSGLVLLALLWALLIIDARVAMIAGAVFGAAYAVFVQSSKRQLAINSYRDVVYRHCSLQAIKEA